MVADALPPPPPASGQLLIYQDGATRLQVRLDGQTVWLSQRLIAELYQVSVKTVNEHLVNIYDEGELDPGATVRSFRIVQREGARDVARAIEHYSLDAILAVGYRVRDFAEGQAQRRRPMHMAAWVGRLDAFLQFNERNVLTHAGSVSHELAARHAHAEFEQHEAERRRLEAEQPASDFDRAVEAVQRLEAGTSGRKASAQVAAHQKPPRRRKPKGDEG